MESTTLTRDELYEMVWRESILSISKKYDISDVGIRKTCKRLDIPTPPNGHWQRLRYGKKSPKAKLPKFNGREEKISWRPRTEEAGTAKAIKKAIYDSGLHINVPEKLTNPDKLIIAAREKLTKTDRYNRYDSVRTSDRDALDIRGSDEFIPRMLRLMDTVIKTLKSRGREIRIEDSGHRPGTYVYFGEEKVQIYLRERMKRVTTFNGHYNQSDLHPSGLLFFRVDGQNAKEFVEGSRTLEEQFPEIIARIELEGQKLIAYKEELKIYWAKQDAERKIEEELEARRQKEVKDLIKLLAKFNRWQQTQQLRQYLDELEKKAILDQPEKNTIPENEQTEVFRAWLKRAREKADWLDPMIEREDEWLDHFDREKVIARANQRD